jgi:dienelactone hydrolase
MVRTWFFAGALLLTACSSDDEGGTSSDGGNGGSAAGGISASGGVGSQGGGGGGASSRGSGGSLGGADGGAAGGAVPASGGRGAGGDPSTDLDGSAPGPDASTAPGPEVDRSDAKLREFILKPVDLDPSVKDSLDDQYAHLDTRVAPLGQLVIFLGGHDNTPIAWRDHGRRLAAFGFHAVLPAYNNRWDDCTGQNCNANTRWEALVGEDVSTAIVASRADSAEGRVVTILKHLATADAGGDWGYYLDGDALRYERIIIAGISHGAASTGVYAARRGFHRAVMHSGGWGAPGANPLTPVSEWYAFAHTGDDAFTAITQSWKDAKMLGATTSIDGQSPPYGDAHQLVTSEPSDYPHGSTAVHSSSPKKNGAYVFDPAWKHLYGVPAAAP